MRKHVSVLDLLSVSELHVPTFFDFDLHVDRCLVDLYGTISPTFFTRSTGKPLFGDLIHLLIIAK